MDKPGVGRKAFATFDAEFVIDPLTINGSAEVFGAADITTLLPFGLLLTELTTPASASLMVSESLFASSDPVIGTALVSSPLEITRSAAKPAFQDGIMSSPDRVSGVTLRSSVMLLGLLVAVCTDD